MVAAENVLTRKLSRGGVARSPLPDTDVIGETLSRMVEDRLRPVVKSAISAMPLEIRVVKLSDAVQDISVPAMLGVVEVEDADTNGLLCLDTDLVYHLIDLMLGGDASVPAVPTTRTFTSVDMALCRIHLDAILDAFAAAVGSVVGRPVTKRISVGDQRQNISQLRVAPDYVDVLAYTISLDIGEAARTGNFMLLMPLATLDTIRASVQEASADHRSRERPGDLWRLQMRRAAASSPVVVNAVLHRQAFTVAAIQALRVGDVIEVPATAPDEISLVIKQPAGRTATLATGRLGAYMTSKVVKLDTPVDPRVRQHLKSAL